MTRISVLMPVHNGEKYIRLAIESVLNQTYQNFELIILDDASIDHTNKIVRSIGDKRIIYKKEPMKIGLAKIRQKSVEMATAEIIAFMDSDDIAHPNRFDHQIKFLKENADIDIVGSWVSIIDHDGKSTGQIWRHATRVNETKCVLFFRNCLTQSSVMMRRKVFENCSYRKEYWAAPDYDLWTQALLKHNIANIPHVLLHYRHYETNMSNKKYIDIEECTKKIHKDACEYLEVYPTDQEVQLHDGLERKVSPYDSNELTKIGNWLSKLSTANELHHVFPNKEFKQLILGYWIKVCLLSSRSGHKIWRNYAAADVVKHSRQVGFGKLLTLVSSVIRSSQTIDPTSYQYFQIARFL